MGFGNWWRQRGKELTNKSRKCKDRLESGKQVVGPVSVQTLVDWRFGECGDKFIVVCTEANIIMGAESADFFFYCWYLKVITDDRI
jgi:hypothetical protein